MALAIDATSNSGDLTSVSSATWSHTCTGSNLILIVGANSRGVKSDTNTTVTGVTYNGVALTKIRADQIDGSSAPDTFRGRSELWYLIAPATGAHNVVVTLTGTVTATGCGAVSFTGAIQGAGAIDAHNGATANTDTTPSVNVTVVASNCYLIDTIYSRSDTLAKDASQTTIMAIASNGGGDDSAMTYKVSPGTGAQTMAWTSGAEDSALSAVSIAPLVSSTSVKDLIGGGFIPFAR